MTYGGGFWQHLWVDDLWNDGVMRTQHDIIVLFLCWVNRNLFCVVLASDVQERMSGPDFESPKTCLWLPNHDSSKATICRHMVLSLLQPDCISTHDLITLCNFQLSYQFIENLKLSLVFESFGGSYLLISIVIVLRIDFLAHIIQPEMTKLIQSQHCFVFPPCLSLWQQL